MFKRPGFSEGEARFQQETELYPCKCRGKSPTSSTFTFNRLSKSNAKVLPICLDYGVCVNNMKSTS